MNLSFSKEALAGFESGALHTEAVLALSTASSRAHAAALRFGMAAGFITQEEVLRLTKASSSGLALASGAAQVMRGLKGHVNEAIRRHGLESKTKHCGQVTFACESHWDEPGLAIYQELFHVADFSPMWRLAEKNRRLVMAALRILDCVGDYHFVSGVSGHPTTEAYADEFLHELNLDALVARPDEAAAVKERICEEHSEWASEVLDAAIFERAHKAEFEWMNEPKSLAAAIERLQHLLALGGYPAGLRSWALKVLGVCGLLSEHAKLRVKSTPWVSVEAENLVGRTELNVVNLGNESCEGLFHQTLNDIAQNDQALDVLSLEPDSAQWVVSFITLANINFALLLEGVNVVWKAAPKQQDSVTKEAA